MSEREPPTRVLGTVDDRERGKAATDPRGLRVAGYAVLDLVGQGGMGAVYRAYDTKLGRVVALKLVLADEGAFLSQEARERLLREAQAMARVSHPNIVKVHDAGTRGKDVFIAMELIDGVTLKGWLGAQPRTVREILRVFVAAGEGLAAAHDVGLVHRDFKPGNVLVDGAGRPFVTDFGLARLVEAAPSSDGIVVDESGRPSTGSGANVLSTELTVAGTVVGTPAYMPPEQHRGEALDGRSDQFSFCVALFEALYGHRPFDGQRSKELVSNVMQRRIQWDTRGRRPPRWLRPILARGLAPEPWQRFSSMQALLGAIGGRRARSRWFRGAAAAACLAAAVLGGTWLARERRAASACGDAGAAIGSIATLKGESARARARLDAFGEAWLAASQQACLEHQIRGVRSADAAASTSDCLDEQRLQVSALVERLNRTAPGVATAATAMLPLPEDCLDRRNALHAIRASDQRVELAEAWAAHAAGDDTEAIEVARRVAAAAAREGEGGLAARAHLLAARASLAAGRAQAAERHGLEAADRAEARGLDRLAAAAWLVRAEAQLRMAVADDRLDRTVAFAEAALQRTGSEASLFARLDLVRAQRHLVSERLEDARDRARAAWMRLGEVRHADGTRGSVLAALARIEAAAGQRDGAASLWLQALARAEAVFGRGHARVDEARRGLRAALKDKEGKGGARG